MARRLAASALAAAEGLGAIGDVDIGGLSEDEILAGIEAATEATEQAMAGLATSAARAFADAFVTETGGKVTTDIEAAIAATITDIREQKRIEQLIRSFGDSLPPEFLRGVADSLPPGLAIEALEDLFDDPASINRIAREVGWNSALSTQGGFDAFDFNFDPEAGGLSASTMNAFWMVGANLAALAQAGFNAFNFDFDPVGGSGGSSGTDPFGGIGAPPGGAPIDRPFHAGGIVPGPRGQERVITALSGEEVIPLGGRRGGGNTTIIVNIPGFIGTQRQLETALRRSLIREDGRGNTGLTP